MAYQFKGFRATKPVARLVSASACTYEAFFVLYDLSGKKRNMRYKAGINSLPARERKAQATETAAVLWEALQSGWNPLQNKYPLFTEAPEVRMDLTAMLDYAVGKKRLILSRYSMYDYEGCVRFIKSAAAATGHLHATEIERRDVRVIMDKAKHLNGWSNKARNKYLSILKSLFSVLVDDELLKFSPAAGIKNEPEEAYIGYRRATDAEQQRIAEHLAAVAPAFLQYLQFIYQDGIRRKETLLLQVRDINLVRQEIRIRPEVAKTNRERICPITPDLMEILVTRQIFNLPADWFIFSNNDFLPGPVAYHPNTPTNWWRKLVIEGLGIDCKMYSLKHKGADDKIKAGIDLDALRHLYGHGSKQMTEYYARGLREAYKQQIIGKAPGMVKKD